MFHKNEADDKFNYKLTRQPQLIHVSNYRIFKKFRVVIAVAGFSRKQKEGQILFLHNKLTTNYEICKNRKLRSDYANFIDVIVEAGAYLVPHLHL